MPTTINGVGTTYFGKKNLEQYAGVCDSCNNATTLSDYETGHFICVLFIPIIPLGRKMILSECPICTRHRVMSLREWNEIKEQSISNSMDALAGAADDPAKAIELLGTYTAFKQYDEAKELAGAIAQSHAADYDTMYALGGWYEQMQMETEADQCFERCLEIDYEHTASKRIRCVTHIQKGEFEQGQALAYELFEKEPYENIAMPFSLASAYLAAERQAEAYEVFRKLVNDLPQLKDDKEFAKDVRKLEKELGVTDSICPKKGLFGWFG